MLRDIGTIIWKDLGEWLGASGKRSKVTLAVFCLVFGVVMPLEWGTEWVSSPVSLFSWAWLPFLLVTSSIADAIAGERERHTLETLLATRLSDDAILLGKMAAAVVYAVGQLWIVALVAAVTVNVAHWEGAVAFYAPPILAGLIAFPLLVAGLAAGIGTLVSMRAPTARAAQQSLTIAMFVFVLPLFAVGFLPDSITAGLNALVSGANLAALPVALAGVLAATDAVLVAIARRRFSRARLAL